MVEPENSTARPPVDWRERFLNAVRQKNPDIGTCTQCKHRGKSTGDHVVTHSIWRDGMTRMEEGFLMAMLVCNNCGHADFYSLKALDIEV